MSIELLALIMVGICISVRSIYLLTGLKVRLDKEHSKANVAKMKSYTKELIVLILVLMILSVLMVLFAHEGVM